MREHGGSADARASHLFTFARAVGDAVCFPGTRRAPVNDLHSAFRQATGRAFAAELLAPARQVGAMREEGRDFVSIAEWFGVSTTAIERQWENRDRIESDVERTTGNLHRVASILLKPSEHVPGGRRRG